MLFNNNKHETSRKTTRRNYIRAAGVAGAGFVAGCSQGDSEGEATATETEAEETEMETETEEEGVDVVDKTFNMYIIHIRPNRQSLNPWSSTGIRPIPILFNTTPVAVDQTTGGYKMHGLNGRWGSKR